ncbi:hypothetical protein [Nocardia sp. NBC_01329]|nr:hypothetical protein OG405_03925 [Nocardia sp. NBC_01329]
MHDDNPGLFSHIPAEPEPYSISADAPQPVFLTATPEPDASSTPDAGAR